MDALDAKRNAETEKRHQEAEAKFRGLTPDSPLEDYLEYTVSEDPAREQAALAGARQVKSRQDDTVRLLDAGRIRWLGDLSLLDLAVTPALCASYDSALRQVAASDEFDWNVGEFFERQLANIRFLVAAHCDLDASLAAGETRVQKIIAVNQGDQRWTATLANLAALHQPR